MRVTEDSMQDAWVALLEKGGPSSVDNPEAWVRGAAKRIQARQVWTDVKHDALMAEACGFYDSPFHQYLAELQGQRREYEKALYKASEGTVKGTKLRAKRNEQAKKRQMLLRRAAGVRERRKFATEEERRLAAREAERRYRERRKSSGANVPQESH